MTPSPSRDRIARRSRRLKLRPRIAASPSAALVRAGRRAARRSMSVRTADGTSRAALRPSRHWPSICWRVPASRCVRASSSTMNGTPSDWACIAVAEAASTGPPRTRFRSSAVSTELNRPGRSRRTRPIRSMSATKFTASLTDANSSGRIVRNRKTGRSASAPDDVAEEPEGIVIGPLDVVDEQRQRADPGERARSRRPQDRRPGGAWRPARGSRTRARHARRWPRRPA